MKLAAVAWLMTVGGGMVGLSAYESTPGAAVAAPSSWPEDSRIERDTTRPTLIMTVHPRCACTRASLTELSRLAEKLGDSVRVEVLYVIPRGASGDAWTHTDLWDRAA